MTVEAPVLNREDWLGAVMDELRPVFKRACYPLPKNIRVTCGFPSTHARSALKRATGESWTSNASGDGTFEVLVSPVEAESVAAAAILAHELSHVAAGHKCGHRGPFVTCIRAVGLVDKPTATHAGEAFKQFMQGVIVLYGEYPHAPLNVVPLRKVQGTRLLRCRCPACGYTVRVTAKWLDLAGPPICPNFSGHNGWKAPLKMTV
jgi:hypothetical protein